MSVSFNNLDVDFKLNCVKKKKIWLENIAKLHGNNLGDLLINWCSDEYILSINNQFLSHNYYTDIITFDHSDRTPGLISGELLISVDTVRSNSILYKQKFHVELLRVMSHGLLHLLGFDDHNDEDIRVMRLMEDLSIRLYEIQL